MKIYHAKWYAENMKIDDNMKQKPGKKQIYKTEEERNETKHLLYGY